MEKLMPCPFCGGEATVIHQSSKYGGFYFAQCIFCKAETKGVNDRGTDFGVPNEFNTPEAHEAEKRWNMRTRGI